MKILLANKFYYPRGGDCIYTLNLEQLLKQHGHETAIFAMQHPESLPTSWSQYFPSEVKFSPGAGMVEAILRPFGTKEVKKKFRQLLDDFKPDVVHLNNIHSQLSPVIAQLAHEKGIRVVWTIHDNKLVCPRYDCIRNGERCELCFEDKFNCFRYRCMKGSLPGSLLGYVEAKKWDVTTIGRMVDTFVAPSKFMKKTLVKGHFPSSQITALCNFIDLSKVTDVSFRKEDYYCYLGRLSSEKGIETLLEAASQLSYKLKVIGGGPLEDELRSKYHFENTDYLGQQPWTMVKEVVSKARFCVLPSECYENNPLSVIESQCLGTPVLGANIGGIPELIEEGKSGMLFESRNADDLKEKIRQMFNTSFDYEALAKEARERYSADNYYNEIMKIYNS